MAMIHDVKCMVVGDGAVGKTSLLINYTGNRFPVDYVFAELNGRHIRFALWDTAGQEEYSRLRALSYPGTDIFLLCFSVINTSSFHNITSKWYPEISHHCPDANTMLVGTKIDLREDKETLDNLKGEKLPTQEMGHSLADAIGAVSYLECSALTREGLKHVFEEAIRAIIGRGDGGSKPGKSGKKKCTLI